MRNDRDLEGDTGLTIVDFTQPQNGRGAVTESKDCDGLLFTPDPEICGKPPVLGQNSYLASFEYTIQDADDKLQDTATVILLYIVFDHQLLEMMVQYLPRRTTSYNRCY